MRATRPRRPPIRFGPPQDHEDTPDETDDSPRYLAPTVPTADRVFRALAWSTGALVLVITGGIGLFLAAQSVPTLQTYGIDFFIENEFGVERLGISSVLLGTVLVGLTAIAIAFPLALLTALYITEYAPRRARGLLVSVIDLMAAVPSIVYGLWGVFLLMPSAAYLARWLHQYLGFLPFFAVQTDPQAAVWSASRYVGSAFIAGIVVAMMVTPIACAVMREVFSSAPLGEREAALALGSTRWGVIRTVVLPFGQGGIIGGAMLGLGRALGETIAVVLVITYAFDLKIRILENGTITTSALIAGRFGEAAGGALQALLTAGLVLFLLTLAVNTAAAVLVARSRSGAATEI